MKFFIAFAALISISFAGNCILWGAVDPNAATPLTSSKFDTICSWYSDDTCCNSQQRNDVAQEILSVLEEDVKTSTGASCGKVVEGCKDAVNSLYCGGLCSPNQASYINTTGSLPALAICNSLVEKIYKKCKESPFPAGSSCSTIGATYKDGKEFILQLPILNGQPLTFQDTGCVSGVAVVAPLLFVLVAALLF